MEEDSAMDHPKKRKRRRINRASISASLVLTRDVKDDIGIISRDLFEALFGPRYISEQGKDGREQLHYAAISPRSPINFDIDEIDWLILPVRKEKSDKDERATTLKCSARIPMLHSFAKALQGGAVTKQDFRGESTVGIRIIDVQPLALDLVIVSVDGDALDRHDLVQARFGGGFVGSQINGSASQGKGKGKAAVSEESHGLPTQRADNQETLLTAAVRDALKTLSVVHQDALLPLPLPTHPITHVPLPPAKIILCEPVSQGLVVPSTKIVVNRDKSAEKSDLLSSSTITQNELGHLITEGDDDTPNERYYSAVEDDRNGTHEVPELGPVTSEDESLDDDDSGSDSSDDVVSMSTPALAMISSGTHSSMSAATPRTSSRRANGIQTPGSVYSNFTATTALNRTVRTGRLFTPRTLLKKIPDDMLHPKPTSDEDDEARVFVDVKMLLRLGCLSGDWVKIEAAQPSGTDHWGIEAFQDNDGGIEDFRVAKIYGLQDIMPKTSAQHIRRHASSTRPRKVPAHLLHNPTPEAWFSPIMLANLNSPKSVRLTCLSAQSHESTTRPHSQMTTKIVDSMSPTVAKELTLLSVSTPLSTELAIQNGLMAAIKGHFHYKRRILREGDLIAVILDAKVSRLLGQTSASADADLDLKQLFSARCGNLSTIDTDKAVAWYRVAQIVAGGPDNETETSNVWGGAFCIEPGTTRMAEAGRIQSKIANASSGCDYYLGLKAIPKSFLSPLSPTTVRPKEQVMPLRRRLRQLMAASTSSRAVHLGMDPVVILLHSTQRNIGKATLASRAASDIGDHVFTIDAYELLTEGAAGGGDVKTEAIFQARVERAMSCGAEFTVILIRHIEALTADRMMTALKDVISHARVLIATTAEIDKVPDSMRGLFTHELEVTAPDEGERELLLRNIVEERGINIAPDVDLVGISIKSAALVAGDLVDIVERALVAREDRLESLLENHSPSKSATPKPLIRDVIVSGGSSARCVTSADFSLAVDAARKNFADAIGAPKIPNVSWDDVGGLTNVKDAVMETIQLPLERPELFAKGMKKRSGILFYGPPGTGKTLLAKAIATEFSLNFFSVKGPELLNMYIGESEANVRRVFQRARDARPCVVFFDELDSVAPKRGNQGDSGGVMDRIVSQLLAELDGMSDGDEGARGGVFVVGATNRPDLLDQALLRPGRFDKMLYLGVADSHDKQLTILEALTRKFSLDPDLDLKRVAESLPFTYTGADLYALASDAMLKAITRRTYFWFPNFPFVLFSQVARHVSGGVRSDLLLNFTQAWNMLIPVSSTTETDAVDRKIKALPDVPVTIAYFFDHLATEADIAVMVTEGDFEAAQKELVGSVSAKELEHYARVRAAFEGPKMQMPKFDKPSQLRLTEPIRGPMPTRSKDKKNILGGTSNVPNGKAKSNGWHSSEEEDEAYITSNDSPSPKRRISATGFGADKLEDEEEMYE